MPTKELIQGGFANVKRSLDRTLATLTPAELKWQPCHDANSIQIILLHMARSEDASIQSRIQKKPEIWETEKWYEKVGRYAKDNGGHYTIEQVNTFTIDTRELIAYFDAVRGKTLEYLKDISDTELERKFTMPAYGPPPAAGQPPRPPMEVIVSGMLLNAITHLVQHIGEISYIRGIQRGMDK